MPMTTHEDTERVSAQVRRSLQNDERLRGSDVRVRAYAGSWGVRVVLEGAVGSWTDRSVAEQHAWEVGEVSGVDNSLTLAAAPS